MKFYYVDPALAIFLGARATGDLTARSPIVNHLHFEFMVCLGDDLGGEVIVHLCRVKLTKGLQGTDLAGFAIVEAELSNSGGFNDLHKFRDLPTLVPHKRRPKFYWLVILGEP